MKLKDYGVQFKSDWSSRNKLSKEEVLSIIGEGPNAKRHIEVYLHREYAGILIPKKDHFFLAGFNEKIPWQYIPKLEPEEVLAVVHCHVKTLAPLIEKEAYLKEIRVAFGVYY